MKKGELKTSHLGEISVTHKGIPMRIVGYQGCEDINVLFLNGHGEIARTTCKAFKSGNVKCYSTVIGRRLKGHNGIAGEVIGIEGHDKVIVRYDSGEVLTVDRKVTRKGHFLMPPYERHDLSDKVEMLEHKGYYLDLDGNVYNHKGRRLHTPSNGKYLFVSLPSAEKKSGFAQYYVHRLMAETFLPNIRGREEVNHKDGNPLNNRLENLEWCTRQENCLHSCRVLGNHTGERNGYSVMTEDVVRDIMRMREAGRTQSEIAASLGIHTHNVQSVLTGRTWNHVTGLPYKSKSKARVA